LLEEDNSERQHHQKFPANDLVGAARLCAEHEPKHFFTAAVLYSGICVRGHFA
jgi:hypothetical protein